MNHKTAKFSIGQLVSHRLLAYRGIVVDVDASCQDQKWRQLAQTVSIVHSGPWYRILVDEGRHMTYVSEQELLADDSGDPVDHPQIDLLFEQTPQGVYKRRRHHH